MTRGCMAAIARTSKHNCFKRSFELIDNISIKLPYRNSRSRSFWESNGQSKQCSKQAMVQASNAPSKQCSKQAMYKQAMSAEFSSELPSACATLHYHWIARLSLLPFRSGALRLHPVLTRSKAGRATTLQGCCSASISKIGGPPEESLSKLIIFLVFLFFWFGRGVM